MIKLTEVVLDIDDGKQKEITIYVNPTHVLYVEKVEEGTKVTVMTAHPFLVTETIEEVVEMLDGKQS